MHIYPDYYKNFKCIADKCKHNCCIGWEIDIDKDTLSRYQTLDTPLKDKFEKYISLEDTPHFILQKDERCPFLDQNNLCEIISTLGEHQLCEICAEHPRFHNEYGDRTESGLGLCCEHACRMILSKKDPVTLIGDAPCDDELLKFRSHLFDILQDSTKPFDQRISDIESVLKLSVDSIDYQKTYDLLISFERMDKSWSLVLNFAKSCDINAQDIDKFSRHMSARMNEYEQLTVYLIYRHLINAYDMYEAYVYALFAVLSYRLIHRIGCCILKHTGDFTFENQIELVRLYSSEIEYSDENLDKLLLFLSE